MESTQQILSVSKVAVEGNYFYESITKSLGNTNEIGKTVSSSRINETREIVPTTYSNNGINETRDLEGEPDEHGTEFSIQKQRNANEKNQRLKNTINMSESSQSDLGN